MTNANGLSEAERTDLCTAMSKGGWQSVYALVERIVAARESAAATRARAEGAAEADRLRAGIWALGESIYGEEGVEHNEGCEGEPDCLACIVADLRALLGGA